MDRYEHTRPVSSNVMVWGRYEEVEVRHMDYRTHHRVEEADPLELLVDASGLSAAELEDDELRPSNVGWISVDKPELGVMGPEDVFPCEECLRPEHANPSCPDCRGHGMLHGYGYGPNQVGGYGMVGHPVVMVVGDDPSLEAA